MYLLYIAIPLSWWVSVWICLTTTLTNGRLLKLSDPSKQQGDMMEIPNLLISKLTMHSSGFDYDKFIILKACQNFYHNKSKSEEYYTDSSCSIASRHCKGKINFVYNSLFIVCTLTFEFLLHGLREVLFYNLLCSAVR